MNTLLNDITKILLKVALSSDYQPTV